MVHRSTSGADCHGSRSALIWISEQLRELGHEVIVANVRELRAISHSDRKSDQVDAEAGTLCTGRSGDLGRSRTEQYSNRKHSR